MQDTWIVLSMILAGVLACLATLVIVYWVSEARAGLRRQRELRQFCSDMMCFCDPSGPSDKTES